MAVLTPSEAAYAAERSYRIIHERDVSLFGNKLTGKFALNNESRFEGVAGASIFKYRSGFGLAARGVSDTCNEFRDDAFIVTRGTDATNFRDILTDAHTSVQRSSSGNFVHTGFNTTYKSFEQDIRKFFQGYNPRRVHCVGHSLGGALASLIAEWLVENNVAEPVLYTFGSPRVGSSGFASNLTRQVNAANIYRVAHSTDPVPWVPTWPFYHVPNPGTECFIDCGMNFASKNHLMDHYIDSVEGKTWESLKIRQPSASLTDDVEKWLKSDGPISFTVNSFNMINKALIWVLKKVLHGVGIGLNVALAAGLTVMDQLAMLLDQAVRMGKEMAGLVERLILKMLNAVGYAISKVESITVNFLRWTLKVFTSFMYNLARRAADAVRLRL
ncbi:lipase family protein [Hahella sp. CR1]|uniref:lipase family protein n=1 Tax=unclassified Hahella TaxID=2624107 RepID=UPI001C1EFAFB|nr:lipase family protein [Hahella sp. CR1]MBU6954606.1 lipase family protein [Hahella sp. HN01]MDG9666920.1 lipase family protein [Hahella sp. CR1]